MIFLIDAQLPPGLCRWFVARGHEAIHVTDVAAGDAPDVQIAEMVEQGGYVLVSKDEDFLVHRLPDRFALIWLRCGNATNRALAEWLDARWDRIAALLESGERLIELR